MGFFSLLFKSKIEPKKEKKQLTPEEIFKKEKINKYNRAIKAIKDMKEIEESEISNFFLRFKSQKKEELLGRIERNRKSCLKYRDFCNENNLPIEIDEKYTDEFFFKLEEKVDPKVGLDNKLKFAKKEYIEQYDLTSKISDNLIKERENAITIINSIKSFIDSIASHPKEFNNTFSMIEIEKKKFKSIVSFKKEEKQNLKTAGLIAAGTATAGAIGGVVLNNKKDLKDDLKSVGKEIPDLGGKFFLAGLGAAALSGGIYYICKNNKIQKDKKDEVKKIFVAIKELKVINKKINNSYVKIKQMNSNMEKSLNQIIYLKDSNYTDLKDEEKIKLGTLVNNTNSLAHLLNEEI